MGEKCYTVLFGSIDTAKRFCELASKQSFYIDIHKGHRVIDGKSILGVLSLDLSKPVVIHLPTGSNLTDDFVDFIKSVEE